MCFASLLVVGLATQRLGAFAATGRALSQPQRDGLCSVEAEEELGLLQLHKHQAASPPKLNNSGIFGIGYNIFKASPFGCGGQDAGLSTGRVFEITYSGQTTPDGRFVIPDGTDVMALATCQTRAESTIVHSASDFSKAVGANLGESLGGTYDGIGGAGSASAAFVNSMEESHLFDNAVSICTQSCSVYRISAKGEARSRVKTKEFRQASKPHQSKDDWYQLFERFGTHILTTLTMGSRCDVVNTYTQTAESVMSQHGMQLSLAASLSASAGLWGVEASRNASQSLSSAQRDAFTSVVTSSELTCHGASPPGGKLDLNAWREIVARDPEPTDLSVQSICTVVMRDSSGDCQAALDTYCVEYLQKYGKATICPASLGRQPCLKASDCGGVSECILYECQKVSGHTDLMELKDYEFHSAGTWANAYRTGPKWGGDHDPVGMEMWVLPDETEPAWASDNLITVSNCMIKAWPNMNSYVSTSQNTRPCADDKWWVRGKFKAWSKKSKGMTGVYTKTQHHTNEILKRGDRDYRESMFYVFKKSPNCWKHARCQQLMPGDTSTACCPTALGTWLGCCD